MGEYEQILQQMKNIEKKMQKIKEIIKKNQIKKILKNYDKYDNLIDKSKCHSIDLDKVEFYIFIGIIFFCFVIIMLVK